ncbi:PiggyBac transposable element-derived protein 3, partial [Trichinella pseudospiralis]
LATGYGQWRQRTAENMQWQRQKRKNGAFRNKLSEKKIRATGTMRNVRTRKLPIVPVEEVRKKKRGFLTTYAMESSILVIKLHHLVRRVQRYSQAQKKHIKIRVPKIVRRYNSSMGGVNTMDKLLFSCRSLQRSKNLFSNALLSSQLGDYTVNCIREVQPPCPFEF